MLIVLDVFLTPLKPRTKTVTAEDVESCLYYMHFPSPLDDDVLAAIQRKKPDEEARHPQHRPLPATPEEPPLLPPRSNNQPPQLPARPIEKEKSRVSNGSIRRKPVTPTTPQLLTIGNDGPASGPDLFPGQRPDVPLLPPRPSSATSTTSSLSGQSVPTAVLVRRDPSSGMQWNVSKIRDPPVRDVSSAMTADVSTKQRGSPLYLEIQTAGYQKFVAQSSANGYSRSEDISDHVPSFEYSTTSAVSTSSRESDVLFRRRMWMEGSHFLTGRNRNRGSADVGRSEEHLDLTSAAARDGGFSSAQAERNSLQVPDEGRLIASGEKRSSVKGYTFMSPWQGRCEFTTSTIGSSLKVNPELL